MSLNPWKRMVLQSIFLVLPFCSSGEASLAMWCSLNLWNTTNDNSEWWLSMANGASWKVVPQARFAMVRRFEQENAAQCSGILCLLLLHNCEFDRPETVAAFRAPSSQCGVYSSFCLCMYVPRLLINLYVLAALILSGARGEAGAIFLLLLISHFLMLRDMENKNEEWQSIRILQPYFE